MSYSCAMPNVNIDVDEDELIDRTVSTMNATGFMPWGEDDESYSMARESASVALRLANELNFETFNISLSGHCHNGEEGNAQSWATVSVTNTPPVEVLE